MIVLVINCGSTSLKYQLIDITNENVLAKGICDRIGLEDSFLKHKTGEENDIIVNQSIPDHNSAVQIVLEYLSHKEHGAIDSMSDITAVGHRVVHGGEFFHDSALVDSKVLDAIKECCSIAPLHNPPNLTGIEACMKLLPNVPNIAVFDTAFHQSMPKYSYLYGLPYSLYEKHKIRKYGFHGTSHKYVANRAANFVGIPIEELKIITCHLGGGASICAVDRGESIDTSMGYTPLEGLIMGTRCGSIDPAIVPYIMEKENLGIKEVSNLMNKQSGILGISGMSSDFRDIQKAAYQYNDRAKLTIDIFCYNIKKYIGQYIAILNGVDLIVFTGGIGEHDWRARKKSLDNLDYLGITIDNEKNRNAVHKSLTNQEIEITGGRSKVRTFVIHTNEELVIAKETARVLK
ncbi:MAG: acetate/propionate family kinase [Deltaproteobacteria bacterium]